ncbi:MAG: hypothetical protein ACUVRU_12955, partial [Anaerolineae bacterium]
ASTGSAERIHTLAWVKPYSSEYVPGPSAEDVLLVWAGLGGGGVVAQPADVFRLDAPAAASRTDLFPWLLAIAVCLLPFDIGARRIAVSLPNLLGMVSRREMTGRTITGRTLSAATLKQNQRISQLMQAKARGSSHPPPYTAGGTVLADAGRVGSRSAIGDSAETDADAPKTAGATAAELLRRRRKQSASGSTSSLAGGSTDASSAA